MLKSLAGAAAGAAFRYAKRKFAKTGFMNYVTPSKHLRGSHRAPDAVKTTSVAFGGQSYRVSGRKCRLRKRRVFYTDVKMMYNQLFSPLRFHIAVGPRSSTENANVNGILLGTNDNIPFGLVPTTLNEGLVVAKLVMPFCLAAFNYYKASCVMNNNLINDAGSAGITMSNQQWNIYQARLNALEPNATQDLSGNTVTGAVYRKMVIGPTTVTHHFWNSGLGSCRLKVIYIKAIQDNTISPFRLWAEDLASQQPNWAANAITSGPASYYNVQTPAYLDVLHNWVGARGTTTSKLSDAHSSNPDYFQTAAVLSGGKLIEPGVGPHFKRFWKKRKSAVYTLGPNEKLSISDCVPKFTVTDGDFIIGSNTASNNVSIGNGVQYRPKWAYGMIFLLIGCDVGDKTLNPVVSAQGAFGPETTSTSVPHLLHSYEIKGSCVNTALNHSNPVMKLGAMIPSAAERNTWTVSSGQVTMDATTDNTAIPSYPLGGDVNISQGEL